MRCPTFRQRFNVMLGVDTIRLSSELEYVSAVPHHLYFMVVLAVAVPAASRVDSLYCCNPGEIQFVPI